MIVGGLLTTLAVGVCGCSAAKGTPAAARAEHARRWEKHIQAFEAKDKEAPPPKDAVLFVGSSSIVRWDVAACWPNVATINRGFGGSYLADVVHFADRVIVPYRPRVIVVYAGDNDIAGGKSAEQVFGDYCALVRTVRASLPHTPAVYIAIKPSLARWDKWPVMREANRMIARYAWWDPSLVFVDVAPPMLDARGKPRKELFKKDGLHLNERGYKLWAELVGPYISSR
jgi:lysophospholipase L1-like esterase